MRALVVNSLEELSDYEEGWEELRCECKGTIYSSYFLTRAWFEAFSGAAAPQVIIVKENGDTVGLAPLCSYRYHVKGFPVKVLSLAGDMRDRLRLSTNAILYRPGRTDVLDKILEEIKGLDWSILWANNMEKSEPIERLIDGVRATWNVIECDKKNNLDVPLPAAGDLSAIYDSNGRRRYRKIANRLEREKVEARLEEVKPEDIDRAVEVYAKQHIERWASKGGSYFRNPENINFMKTASKEAHARHCGYAYNLLLNGEVAAQTFGFLDEKKAYGERVGMEESFSRYSPGWLIFHYCFSKLRDQGVEECRLGWGGESFKYELGGQERPLVGIGATRGMMSLAARLIMQPRMQGLKDRLGIMAGKKDLEQTPARSLGPEHD